MDGNSPGTGVLAGRSQIDYALEAARLGYKVFPCRPESKAALITAWEHRATNDEKTIRRWWSKWPQANIAAAVGAGDITVLDVDVKAGKGGVDSLADLEGRFGDLPRSRVAKTPSGGLHIHMQGTTASRIEFANGLDVKSSGGYVLMPGSFIGGRPYTWHRVGDLQAAPEWFLREIGAPKDRSKRVEILKPPAGWDNALDVHWARDFLAKDAERATEGKRGDRTTYEVACALHDKGISEEKAVELMTELYNPRCEPPWAIDDNTNECLKAKIANAYRYAEGTPGCTSIAADFLEPADFDKSADWPSSTPTRDDTPSQRSRFRELSLRELMDVTAPRWLVDRLIPENGLAVVYGQPKSCKTFWAIDLSLSVATGTLFHGVKLLKGRATYVAAEGGTARIRDRARAWLHSHGFDDRANLDWGLLGRKLDLTNGSELTEFLRALDGHRDLIVIDTLARCMSGDENTQKDMGAFIAGCDRIREASGAAVLVVHHEGKDGSKGARGSNALRGAVDAGINVKRDNDGTVTVKIEDLRDDEPAPPMCFRLENVVLSGIEDASAVLRTISDKDTRRDDTVLDLALSLVGEPKKRLDKAVAEALRVSETTARHRIEDAGLLEGREHAVEHGGWRLWLKRTNPGNSRSGLVVCGEKVSDTEVSDTTDI
jgi:RecA-family ATPase